jgi:putative NADH-flavin reductase
MISNKKGGENMKFTVVGSTSPTGLQVLEKGIKRGHEITAFTRRRQKLAHVQGLEAVIQGNGLEPADVKKAVAGQDAVIAIVGSENKKAITETTDVMRIIVGEMQKAKVNRLLFVSSYLLDGNRPRIILPLIRRIYRHSLADLRSAEQFISSSSTDWTIVRPTALNDNSETNKVRITKNEDYFQSGPYEISRSDLANVLLDGLERGADIQSTIKVTWAKKSYY